MHSNPREYLGLLDVVFKIAGERVSICNKAEGDNIGSVMIGW